MATTTTPKNRGGRPRKSKIQAGEKTTISVRITSEVRKHLEAAIAKNGRSLTQEVEMRIERSFELQRLLPDALQLAYGRQAAGLLMVIGRFMEQTGPHLAHMSTPDRPRRDNWLEDAFAYDAFAKGLQYIIEAFRPEDPVVIPPMADATLKALQSSSVAKYMKSIDDYVQSFAGGTVAPLAGRSATAGDKAFAAEVLPLLGKLAEVEGEKS